MRISAGAGLQVTERAFETKQSFEQYLETGSFTFARIVPRRPMLDAGLDVRVFRRLHAGVAVTFLDDSGAGTITAEVPNPVQFDSNRSVAADIPGVARREGTAHIHAAWTFPISPTFDVTVFGGPSLFMTQQTYVSSLVVGLEHEIYPFDTFAFAGAATDTFKENVLGYHAGADVTWRFSKHVGAGMLVRYANGRKDFTPPGGSPFTVETGGVHVSGGLRILLHSKR